MRKRSVGINVRVSVTEKKKVTMMAKSAGCLSRNTYASGRWDMNRADTRPRRYLMCWINWMKLQRTVLHGMGSHQRPDRPHEGPAHWR